MQSRCRVGKEKTVRNEIYGNNAFACFNCRKGVGENKAKNSNVFRKTVRKKDKKVVDSLHLVCYSDTCTIMDKIAFYAFCIEDNGVCQ